jgi:hypothetical protein
MSSAAAPSVTDRSGALLRGPLLAVSAVVMALGYRFFRFIFDYSVNVLYYDQWDFLSPLFEGRTGFFDLFFQQHGPHREGLGLVATGLLYSMTHWNTRAEAFMVGAFVFAAMLLALLLKRKLFGGLSYWDVTIPAIFLTLVQNETFLGAINPAFSSLPLLLIMLYCLVLIQRKSMVRYGLLLLFNILLIYTGFGFFMGLVTLGLLALEWYRAWRKYSEISPSIPAWSLVVAAVSLASFFVKYVPLTAVECFQFPYYPLFSYPWFMAVIFSAFLGPRGPVILITAAGAIALLFVAGVLALQIARLVRPKNPGGSLSIAAVVAVLMSYSLLFVANAAVGRVCLGLPAAAQASRYSTLLIPAYLAVYLYLFSLPVKSLRMIALAAFLFVLTPGAVVTPGGAANVAASKRAWAACYLQAGSVVACNQMTGLTIYLRERSGRLQHELEFLREHRLSFFSEGSAR